MGCKILKRVLDPDIAALGEIFHRQGGACYGKSMYQI